MLQKHKPQSYTSLLRHCTDFSVHMAEVKETRLHTLPVRTFCLNPTPTIETGNEKDRSKYSPYSLHKHQNTNVKQAIKTNRVKMKRW